MLSFTQTDRIFFVDDFFFYFISIVLEGSLAAELCNARFAWSFVFSVCLYAFAEMFISEPLFFSAEVFFFFHTNS